MWLKSDLKEEKSRIMNASCVGWIQRWHLWQNILVDINTEERTLWVILMHFDHSFFMILPFYFFLQITCVKFEVKPPSDKLLILVWLTLHGSDQREQLWSCELLRNCIPEVCICSKSVPKCFDCLQDQVPRMLWFLLIPQHAHSIVGYGTEHVTFW